jgi:hypothetical protein
MWYERDARGIGRLSASKAQKGDIPPQFRCVYHGCPWYMQFLIVSMSAKVCCLDWAVSPQLIYSEPILQCRQRLRRIAVGQCDIVMVNSVIRSHGYEMHHKLFLRSPHINVGYPLFAQGLFLRTEYAEGLFFPARAHTRTVHTHNHLHKLPQRLYIKSKDVTQ